MPLLNGGTVLTMAMAYEHEAIPSVQAQLSAGAQNRAKYPSVAHTSLLPQILIDVGIYDPHQVDDSDGDAMRRRNELSPNAPLSPGRESRPFRLLNSLGR